MFKRLGLAILTFVLAMGLLGCASTAPMGQAEPMRPNEMLAGTPLPPGSVVVNEKSLLIGGPGHWVGRLVLNLAGSTQDAFAFFEEHMPAKGWKLISSVRGEQSLMVLTQQDLTATVAFTEGSGFGAGTATLTVTPRNSALQAPNAETSPVRR